MKRIFLAVALMIGLAAVLGLLLGTAQAAGGDCPSTYTVRWGDTLSQIAARTGLSVQYLAELNGIEDVDRIFAGQVLCLRPPALGPQPSPVATTTPFFVTPCPAPQPRSSFDLVAEYTFSTAAYSGTHPAAEPAALNWTLGRDGRTGIRLSYPLFSGDAIKTFSETLKVWETSTAGAPLLWLERNGGGEAQAASYTLVVIGDPQPLLDLQVEMTPTKEITDILPTPEPGVAAAILGPACPEAQPVSVLAGSGAPTVTLTLRAELVSTRGVYIPVAITKVAYLETMEQADCFTELGFALHPTANPALTGYELLMVLTDDGTVGPPGEYWAMRCESWKGGGWWSRWLRAWYGC